MSFSSKSIKELHGLYRSKAVSVEEVLKDTIARIEKTQPALSTFAFTCFEDSLKKAKALDQQGMPAHASPLWGIPVALKDNM